MKSLISCLNFLLAISALCTSASAIPQSGPRDQARSRSTIVSTQVCGTRYGPRYAPLSTSRTTTTSTIKSTTVLTSLSTVTVTPSPSTSTLVSTTTIVSSVTASTPISVSTSTVTSVVTQTVTTDSTTTDISTTTVTSSVTATSFVPTPAGFVPIGSSLPGAGLKKRGIDVRSERRQAGRGSQGGKLINSANAWSASGPTSGVGRYPTQGSPPGYPTAVQCTTTVYLTTVVTSTSTIRTTVTVSSSTVTTTSTTSATTTSTILPTTVTSIISTTTIETIVSTSTNTVTATTTVPTTFSTTASTVTSYAACQTDNLAGSYQGGALVGWGFSTSNYQSSLNTYNADSAAGCCELAATIGLAWFFNFYPTVPVGSGNCDIIIAQYCPVPTATTIGANGATTVAQATVFYSPGATPSAFQVSGNGPCGVVNNASL